jgi:hypothetical protein
MHLVKDKIIFPIIGVILVASLIGPYFVKISHALYEHEKLHCISTDLHIHEIEFDCDFEHYQLSTFYYPLFNYPNFIDTTSVNKTIINNYFFLSKYQQLHFVLRGPPTC